MPEFVYKTIFKKELCRGPEETESMGKDTDCPSCIAFSFADLPCTIMSNETVVILNPTLRRENCSPPDSVKCKEKDYEIFSPENILRFDKALIEKGHTVKNRCPGGGFEI